jgi:hypothetical protein
MDGITRSVIIQKRFQQTKSGYYVARLRPPLAPPSCSCWTHQRGGFYHDGRFAALRDVIDNYNAVKSLGLTGPEVADLAEYLRSL